MSLLPRTRQHQVRPIGPLPPWPDKRLFEDDPKAVEANRLGRAPMPATSVVTASTADTCARAPVGHLNHVKNGHRGRGR